MTTNITSTSSNHNILFIHIYIINILIKLNNFQLLHLFNHKFQFIHYIIIIINILIITNLKINYDIFI